MAKELQSGFFCCAGDRSVRKGFFRISKWGIGSYHRADHFFWGGKMRAKSNPKSIGKKAYDPVLAHEKVYRGRLFRGGG
jgi:hypothetical protein